MAVGIIGAMEVEVEIIRAHMEGASCIERAGMRFVNGTLNGRDVVVVRCGVGKVCAAACVQALVDVFGVDAVVNTGVAGSLDASIDIGDLVVATDAMHHDVDATVFGYAPGEVPMLGRAAFDADAGVSGAIERAADAVSALGKTAGEEAGRPDGRLSGGFRAHRGRVVSGDQFVADAGVKARLANDFGGACCEMEGAAIAQACWMNGIPFAIVRCISDKADGSDVMDYPEFEKLAARRCAAVVEQAMTEL